jgi:hypothetical protein
MASWSFENQTRQGVDTELQKGQKGRNNSNFQSNEGLTMQSETESDDSKNWDGRGGVATNKNSRQLRITSSKPVPRTGMPAVGPSRMVCIHGPGIRDCSHLQTPGSRL